MRGLTNYEKFRFKLLAKVSFAGKKHMAGLKWFNEYAHNSATLLSSILNLEIHLELALSLTFSKYFYDVVIFILT